MVNPNRHLGSAPLAAGRLAAALPIPAWPACRSAATQHRPGSPSPSGARRATFLANLIMGNRISAWSSCLEEVAQSFSQQTQSPKKRASVCAASPKASRSRNGRAPNVRSGPRSNVPLLDRARSERRAAETGLAPGSAPQRSRRASHQRQEIGLTCGSSRNLTADLLPMRDQVSGTPPNCPPFAPQSKRGLRFGTPASL